jgi:hypothetical protein
VRGVSLVAPFDVGICIEVHQLLILQMNREMVDGGFCSIHGEFKDMVAALNGSNVVCIQILLDLVTVLVILKLQGGAVMAFEDVLVDVLE